jgi:hypothetical protein
MNRGDSVTDNNVTDIGEARRKKKSQLKEEQAPFEAFHVEALDLGNGAFVLAGGDGDHSYVWIADRGKTGKRKTFRVREVYPGLDKKKTPIRDADEEVDLLLKGGWTTIDEVKEDLNEILFEGFEVCELDGDESSS